MEDSEWKMDRRKSGKRESGNNWKTEGFIRELRQVTRIFREDDKFAKFAKLGDGFPISAFCFPNFCFVLHPPHATWANFSFAQTRDRHTMRMIQLVRGN
ncbi:MAG: hypothetical protein ABSE16_10980 [Verrucomicrobiota bacterium]